MGGRELLSTSRPPITYNMIYWAAVNCSGIHHCPLHRVSYMKVYTLYCMNIEIDYACSVSSPLRSFACCTFLMFSFLSTFRVRSRLQSNSIMLSSSSTPTVSAWMQSSFFPFFCLPLLFSSLFCIHCISH